MLHRWQPLPSKNDATRRSAATVRRTSNQSSRPSISTFDGHRVLGALTLAARTGAGPSNSRYYGARISTRRSRWAEPPPGPSSGGQSARCTRRRVFVGQRPAGVLCRWCSQCRSAADRAARDRNTIRSSQFRRSSAGSRRSAWSSPPHHAVLETPHTAQLRLSGPEADATCEHQRNRADEAVLIGLNLGAGEHLLRDSISDTLCDERVDRFQTRVGTGGEKERKCLQKKTQLGGVRF